MAFTPLSNRYNLSYFLLAILIIFINGNGLVSSSLNDGNDAIQPSGKIIFSARDTGNRNIYAINYATSELSLLAKTSTDIDGNLALSPDKKSLLFSEIDKNDWNIYNINMDGTNKHVLTNTDGGYPSWSPDGKRIAFVSWRSGRPKIYVMNTDGSNQQQLLKSDVHEEPPQWSPDGKEIAITSVSGQVIIVSIEDPQQYRIIENAGSPAWSPNGKLIAYSGLDVGVVWSIYVMDSDGTNTRNLTPEHISDAGFIDWSPDETQMSFTTDNPINNLPTVSLYTMDTQGRKSEVYISGIKPTTLWSPDGNYLASVVNCQGKENIYIVSIDRTTENCVSTGNLSDIVLSAWIN